MKLDRDAALEILLSGDGQLAYDLLSKIYRSDEERADNIALDRASVRVTDKDGHLHVERANISKANVCPYNGGEIPKWESLGLDKDRVYYLYRDPEELAKGAETFNGKPLLLNHKPTSAEDHQTDLVVGAVMNPEWESPYLKAELVVWPGEAIGAIEDGSQKELSCGYHYRADMTPGSVNGERYDGVMRDIVGNHVAIVAEGRAGPDVVIGDSKHKENIEMSKIVLTRKAAMAQGALTAYLRPKMAQDAKVNIAPALASVTAKNFKESKPAIAADIKKLTAGKLAKDANISDIAELLDALEDTDVTEGADIDPNSGLPMGKLDDKANDEEAETEEEKKARMDKRAKDKAAKDKAKDCKGMDADEDEEDADYDEEKSKKDGKDKKAKDKKMGRDDPENFKGKPEITKSAMDAAIKVATDAAVEAAVKQQVAIRDAERAVRPYVGELAMSFDSADGVYAKALEMMNVKTDGVHPSAFPAILAAQPKRDDKKTPAPKVGMDAAGAASYAEMFPNASKIGRA